MPVSASSSDIVTNVRANPRLQESIRSYDADPSAYADRYEGVDLASHRSEFLKGLGERQGLVVDAGCGGGRDGGAFLSSGRPVLGIDLSLGMLNQAHIRHPHLPLVRADLQDLPLCAGSCVGVWSLASLVHLDIEGVATALGEFARVLRPGGILFVSVPWGTSSEWRSNHLGGRRWFQYHQPKRFAHLVEAAGFRLVQCESEPGVASGRWTNVLATRP